MTLLELLRQELPKRGGWPEGAVKANCYGFIPGVHFWDDNDFRVDCSDLTTRALEEGIVTREQYEAAGWNGEGLPPVDCECEFMKPGKNWSKGTIKYISEYTVVIDDDSLDGEFIAHPLGCNFRPIRSEADKKRDAAIEAIDWYMPECILDTPNESGHAKKIYDAIAAGKIPGVKLEV